MADQFSESVAATIRAELARRRKSQKDLADALGFSQVAMSRRLNGATPIDVNELAQIAEFLGMPVEALLTEAASA
jgi:transcriptional regulator with XRE-family HTH domain